MNLGRYPSEVYGLAEEIKYEFSEEEIEQLFFDLSKMGFAKWLKWKQENHQLIIEYLQATPSKRSKLNKFKPNQPLLAFAAFQHCLAGYKLLIEIETNFIAPGQTYRGMAASAANAYQAVCEAIEHELWPWEGNPFESNV